MLLLASKGAGGSFAPGAGCVVQGDAGCEPAVITVGADESLAGTIWLSFRFDIDKVGGEWGRREPSQSAIAIYPAEVPSVATLYHSAASVFGAASLCRSGGPFLVALSPFTEPLFV